MSTQTAPATHKIRWFVYDSAGADKRLIPHQASMRGFWPGYEAKCSCGWETKTGGAVRSYIRSEIDFHKFETSA